MKISFYSLFITLTFLFTFPGQNAVTQEAKTPAQEQKASAVPTGVSSR